MFRPNAFHARGRNAFPPYAFRGRNTLRPYR